MWKVFWFLAFVAIITVVASDAQDSDLCPGQNEFYDMCISGCSNQTCETIGKVFHCPIQTTECRTGCRCKPNFYRNANNVCVSESECDSSSDGTENLSGSAEVDSTAQDSIDTNTSDNSNFKYGDLSSSKNAQDNDLCSGQNEFYDECISGCSNQTCATIGKVFHCPIQTTECRTGCRCLPNFYRNADNVCVSESECGCGSDPNAHSGCGVNCGKTCSTYRVKHPFCPAICKVGGCDCNDGYVFDSNIGKCVSPQDCTPICGSNEQFNSCTNGGCDHRNCSQVGQPQICIDRTPESCTKGCVCVQGYLRADNGTCVPQEQCPRPGCGGDLNAHSGCGVNCGKTCATYKAKNPICPRICKVGGCDCNDGYVFDSNIGKCVSPQDCTPICGLNEQFDSCTNGGCDHRNCTQVGQPQICIDRTPESCTKGCVCVQGYLRADNGTCVPQEQCSTPGCGGDPNAQPGCGYNCGKTCSTYRAKHPLCPRIVCEPTGCDCKDGYVLDENIKKCVLPQKCILKTTTTPATPVIIDTTTTKKSPSTDSGDNNGGTNKNGLENLQAGVTRFTGKFLFDRMKANQGENIITSPYSVFTPLAQLALYADGDCLKELTSVLNLSDKQSIRSTFPALVASFDGQTSVNFSTAAKVYSNDKYPLSNGFKKDSIDVFHAEAQELDFSKASEAADIINTWVENKTNDRIKDLIAPSDLSSLTRLVLVNAIYFKGDWLYYFDKANTKDADFYLSDGTTRKTKLMYQEAQFNYGEDSDLNCKILEMPYKGNNFSMVIVLPNEIDGIIKTAEALQDEANVNKVLESMRKQKVQVYVPPFEINTETDLADILKEEGITKIFDQKDSGLSGMLEKPEDVYVSKAIQKAFIKLDETGSEAAAANGVVVSTRNLPLPPPQPKVFRADRAFLFYIRVKATTMFCGAFVQ